MLRVSTAPDSSGYDSEVTKLFSSSPWRGQVGNDTTSRVANFDGGTQALTRALTQAESAPVDFNDSDTLYEIYSSTHTALGAHPVQIFPPAFHA